MKRLLLLFTVGSSCGQYVPPAAPDYDEQCNPTDDFYLKLGQERVDIEALGDIPADPEAALLHCREKIESRGWVLVEKGGDPETQWARFNTTLGNTTPAVLLGADWDERSVEQQAGILCHEAVHTFQWERFGDLKFLGLYAQNEGTVALEAPAYYVSMQVWKAQNPDGDAKKQAQRYVTNLMEKYRIVYMPRACAEKQILDIILQETP